MKVKTRKQRFNEIISATNHDLNACVIELAESYLKDFPNSQGAWDMYSLALYRIDRLKEAKKALSKAIELTEEPSKQQRLSWLLCRMGHIYENSGKFLKAIEWYHKAHLADHSEATFLIYEGVVFLRIEKFDEAAETFLKATQCSEGYLDEAFYNLGVVRLVQKKYDEAVICFEKALEIDSKYKEAKQQLKDVKRVLEILESN
jgi:tetratricopeptide (TPR) repeat protein